MTDTQPAAQRSGTAGFVQRHPMAAFLGLALPLSFALMSLPAMAQYEMIPGKTLPARLGLDMEEAASILLVLTLFAVAMLVTALEGGRTAVVALARRMTRWRVALLWWAVAVTAFPVTTIGLALLLGDSAQLPSAATLLAEAFSALIALLFINIWEEAVWAGFLQTRLERRHNFFVAAALTSVPFAAVHMPLRIITGEATTPAELLSSYLILLVFMLFIRSLLGAILRGAANSILLVAITHTSFNRSNNIDGIASDLLQGGHRQTAALLATVIITITIVVGLRRQLSREHRATLNEREQDSGPSPIARLQHG